MEFNLGLDQDLINAVSQIVEASCSAKKMEKEELHPNQVKLDKNKNGKLDSDDFKKLRKEEDQADESYVSNAQRKAVWASKNEKGVKEEVEDLTEISKKVIGSYVKKASNDLASSVHGERDAEQDDEHDAQEYHAKRAEKRMSGLERAGNKLAKEGMEEFAKSQAKKRAEDRKAKEKMSCEEVEELDELSKGTLGSYVKKAGQQRVNMAGKEKELDDTVNGLQRAKHNVDDDSYSALSAAQDRVSKQRNAVTDKSLSRAKGIHTALKKLTKEQVEEIEALAAKHGLGE